MAELLASKLQIVEEEPRIPGFPTLPTAVLGIVGISERGPIAQPQLITSFEEYENTYGGFVNGREMAQAVRMFFLNGGRSCWVSRTVHYTDVSNKATATAVKGTLTLQTAATAASGAVVTGTNAAPFALQPNDTIVASVEGNADDTATFTATAASVECANAETYALSDGDTLTVEIDGGSTQTVTFNTADFTAIGAATAEEVAQVINQDLSGAKGIVTTAGTKVTIESDTKGTSSSVEVTGGTANAVLGFSTALVPGTGNVADISAVTFTEAKAILEAALTAGSGVLVSDAGSGAVRITTVATGATITLQVQATSTAETVFGFPTTIATGSDSTAVNTLRLDGRTEGSYANSLNVRVADSSSGDAAEFNLQVSKSGVILESFANLTMDSTAERYALTVINDADAGSLLLEAFDEAAPGTPADKRPANVSGASPASGNDGLTGLDDNDYIGSQSGLTGVHAFDEVETVTILCIPDETSTAVQNKMIDYCENDRERLVFAILDPAAGQTAVQVIAQRDALSPAQSESGAMYWPRVKIVNPSKTVFGDTRDLVIAPSGMIAGIMARNDLDEEAGTFTQPAGVEKGLPVGVTGLETEEVKLENKRDLVFPKRINPITSLNSFGIFVDGARTLKGTGNFPSIGERRGVSQIERLLKEGLQFARHQNNTPALRRRVERAVTSLLLGFTLRGSLASSDPTSAFFVDVSDKLNPPSVVRSGKLILRVGLATASPAEFIIVRIAQDTRALEEELLSAGL